MSDEWTMHGMAWEDPWRIRSWQELEAWIGEVGFLPLFRNEAPGFSAEEHVSDLFWWTGDPEQDPWLWRELIARNGNVAYGKFFGGKAGFVSREWFPAFANYRRDGYDFDTLWEEGMASSRSKKIMDCLLEHPELSTVELKRMAGFGKDGEKNFSGILTDLQMKTFVVVRDFRRKVSRAGLEYGMSIGICTMPESLWDYDSVTACYTEDPGVSGQRIYRHILEKFPEARYDQLKKIIK